MYQLTISRDANAAPHMQLEELGAKYELLLVDQGGSEVQGISQTQSERAYPDLVRSQRRRRAMREIDTAARAASLTSGLDAERFADISTASADVSGYQKAVDEFWRRAMKNTPCAEGLRDDGARKAVQRIVKEIRARRNPRSFDGTEFASSLGDV